MAPTLRGLVALWLVCGVTAVAAPGGAATPCTDEPDLGALACRVSELGETAVEPRLAHRVAALGARVARAADLCARGRSQRTEHTLTALGIVLDRLRRSVAQQARHGGLDPALAADLGAAVRLIDALRRAAAVRLARHPCPALVEFLRPERGEVVPAGKIDLLLRLSPDADPSTLQVEVEAAGVTQPIALAALSQTQAWARLPCLAGGRHVLHVRIRDRGGTVTDDDEQPLVCGASRLAIGAEVETLIDEDHGPGALRLTPVRPLRSGATYAVAITSGLRAGGRPVAASPAFAVARHRGPRHGGGRGAATAYYAVAADDPRNPFPSERLVNADGTVRIPDGFTARALPAIPRLDGVRRFLRALDAGSEEHHGFSPNTPVVLTFDAPVDLESATPDHVLLVELANPGAPGSNLRPLIAALERDRGIAPGTVAVASVFPVEDVTDGLATIRGQIGGTVPVADYTDPDPSDARVYGVFHPGDPGFADFFGGAPPATVGTVARGAFPSPDYRIDKHFPVVPGGVAPPYVSIEFLLAVPAGSGPFPTVIVQHGFGGDDTIVTQLAGDFTAAGLALIGIPAPEHGPRGNFFQFFDFDDFNAFGDNWRQASVDLMQLTQLIATGLPAPGDPLGQLRQTDLGFLGVSLGGIIGGVFTAVETRVTAAVLNVAGARLSQLSGAASPFAEPFLARFAAASGIPARTCGGSATAPACKADADCGGGSCLRNPDFTLLLDGAALDWQTQLDPGDGAGYSRRQRLEPGERGPRAVLVQEGIGDVILANPLTEALARALALPANRADAAPAGVAGLWRYPPPTGHDILGLPEVLGQAIVFLSSGGTVLPSPAPTMPDRLAAGRALW